MADSIPALCAGGLLLVFGIGLAWFQWRFRQPRLDEDESARLHAAQQLRRRLQVSALIVFIGILIPLGDLLPFFRKAPVAFALFWLAILGLAFWIILLAVADLVSARLHLRRVSLRLRQQRRQLEQEIDRYRAQGNGHSPESN